MIDGDAMTRWKYEFRAWAARERLRVWTMPKDWHDWQKAKAFSLMCDNVAGQMHPQLMLFSEVWDPARW